jgi:hypothetical protein
MLRVNQDRVHQEQGAKAKTPEAYYGQGVVDIMLVHHTVFMDTRLDCGNTIAFTVWAQKGRETEAYTYTVTFPYGHTVFRR